MYLAVDAQDPQHLKNAARSEKLLLYTYNVTLPPPKPPTTTTASRDKVSENILRKFAPIMLADHQPLSVYGDGSCFYRTVSLARFSSQQHHTHIRLLSALEMVQHPEYYDAGSPGYVNLIQDPNLVTDPYQNLLRSVCKSDGWSEMSHVYSTSAALSISITSYCPPILHEHYLARPLSRRVCGRGLSSTSSPQFTIMWTMTSTPVHQHDFIPNHFVVLHKKKRQQTRIDLTTSPLYSKQHSNPDPSPRSVDKNSSPTPSTSTSRKAPSSRSHKWQHVNNKRKHHKPNQNLPQMSTPTKNQFTGLDSDTDGELDLSGIRDQGWSPPHKKQKPEFPLPKLHKYDRTKRRKKKAVNLTADSSYDTPSTLSSPVSKSGSPVSNQGSPVSNSGLSVSNQGSPMSNSHSPVCNQGSPLIMPKATGGKDLPKPGKFMDTHVLLKILTSKDEPLERIPVGVKEDQFFSFMNEDNIIRRERGESSRFWDDCGAWKSGPTNTCHILHKGLKLINLTYKDGKYFERVRKCEGGVRRERLEELDPQPHRSNITVLHRAYCSHTQADSYKRRISWIEPTQDSTVPKISVAEYVGSFLGNASHGNAKGRNPRDYIKMPPKKMDNIKEQVRHRKPKDVYQQHVLAEPNDIDAPRAKKQVENIRYNEKKKDQQSTGKRANFADHIERLENMVQTHPYVQQVIHTKDKVPMIILYTNEMLEDCKRFCASMPLAHTTPLGYDKTYGLTDLHVTAGVYKNLALVQRGTGEHPLFIGPIFIHGNSDTKTFHSFFSHLRIELELCNAPSQPLMVTDEEGALRKAIKIAFPESKLLACTRHLKNNTLLNLKDKVGASEKDRNRVAHGVYGTQGVTSANDDISFDYLLKKATTTINKLAPNHNKHFQEKTVPLLRENLKIQTDTGIDGLTKWTSNNSESLNAVFKHKVKWTSQNPVDLVLALYDLVNAQFKEVRRSFVGLGNYALCKPFQSFYMPIGMWSLMSTKQQDAHLWKFVRKPWAKDNRKITSSSGERHMLSGNGGRKPGQRKRLSRTVTITKKRL